ncbi:NADP-dependent oxidoreductase domain-containing protein [Roridomyces roridus]|uniref:NADP-dependent oxidoreductase domain-containing protein n=1 Tax=Roridomyces roridus TaxID=1738132 RepID=A0AAD7B036_9AGAR|nr:NADP-dependent oxidoreductase domain-containing protein [Roridomyces roridus]
MSPTRSIENATFSAIGFGAMGISGFYGAIESDEDRFKVLDAAYAAGCTFWDTADMYGDSEELIGKWFKRTGKRSEIFLATKFGFKPDFTIDGTPARVHEAAKSSLARLDVDYIDLYYLHRPDKSTPIEHTIGAMAELVKEGKVKHIGISESSAATLRRAHAVHPIAAYQVEYSPFTLDIEDPKIGILTTARELGVKIIAYSPLGRGLLTGQYKSPADFAADDFRRMIPRYSTENFPNILKIVEGLGATGAKYNATPGQVALAWVLAQGEDVIPIPGTKKIKYLEENLAAGAITLSAEDIEAVRELASKADAVQGERYPVGMTDMSFADTPELGA